MSQNTAKDIIEGTLYAREEVTSNNIVRMYKGDSLFATLFLNKGTLLAPIPYELTENDTVYFGVSEVNHTFADSIIRKIYNHLSPITDDGDLIIMLEPDDTEFLLPGMYYYSIKVTTNIYDEEEVLVKEEVNTVTPMTPFYILA